MEVDNEDSKEKEPMDAESVDVEVKSPDVKQDTSANDVVADGDDDQNVTGNEKSSDILPNAFEKPASDSSESKDESSPVIAEWQPVEKNENQNGHHPPEAVQEQLGASSNSWNQHHFNPLDMTGEVWVETKTADSKSYYYHAATRETTWTKPEGPNVKIVTQEMIEQMVGMNASTAEQSEHEPQEEGTPDGSKSESEQTTKEATSDGDQLPDGQQPAAQPQPTPDMSMAMPMMTQPPPNMMPGYPPQWGAPPQGPFPGQYPGGYPPPFAQYPPPQPGGYNPYAVPWGMPPMHMPGMDFCKPPPTPEELSKIDPKIVARAADWNEYRAPDGRPYYYNTKRGESVWEKPTALKDLETARLAAAQGISTLPSKSSDLARKSKFDVTHPVQQHVVQQPMQQIKQQQPLAKKPMQQLQLHESTALKVAAGANAKGDDDMNGRANELEMEARKRAEESLLNKQQQQKSEEEKKEGDVKKLQDRGRPVTSTPVPGTPWCVVWTGDGRVFFYNPSTRTSVWERPDELIARPDVDKLVSTPPDVVMEMSGGNLANATAAGVKRSESMSSTDATPAKRLKEHDSLSQSSFISNFSRLGDTGKQDASKEAAIEAEVRAARERALIPLETRIKSFRDMLAEKDVSAFSTWEKELHKIVFDPRYLLLTSKERKQVFEKYVKERADEERREKRNKMKQKRDDFKSLMDFANLHSKSSFNEFAAKFGKEERFRAIEKVRERESLFNEYILEIRKREKEEKMQKRDQVKKEYFQLLRENAEIDRHSRYSEFKKKLSDDPRFKAIDSGSWREDWFRDYIKLLKEERKKDKKDKDKKDSHRKEKKRDRKDSEDLSKGGDMSINSENIDGSRKLNSTDWSDDDGELKRKHDKANEDGEGEDDEEEEEERARREKQARMEASLREREKEVQRTLATHLRDRDKEREQHKKDEAVQHFNALLTDLIRNPDQSWREAKKVMRKDHRWELAESLERDEREKLFNAHIEQLILKKREKFRELLTDSANITFDSSWKEVKKLIKEDPRYVKFSSSDRKMEREFKEFIKDKFLAAKSDFKQLLQETKLITHMSKKLIEENEQHLQDIEDILRNDKRYLVLEQYSDDRRQLLLTYLDDLEKRGPPPPPTASEPNRRNK